MIFFSTSLQVKLNKHATFEAEVQAHKYMLDGVEESGVAMVNDEHETSEFILVSMIFFILPDSACIYVLSCHIILQFD